MAKDDALAVSDEELRKEFSEGYAPKRVWPNRNRIRLDNERLQDDEINDGFGCLFVEGHDVDDSEEGFTNFSRKLDFKKTQLFVLKVRQKIRGPWDDVERKFKYEAEEVGDRDPIEVVDSEGNEIYTGFYNKEMREKYNLSWKAVLYVCLVEEGKILPRRYRWELTGTSLPTWGPTKQAIDDKAQVGKPHAVKVIGTTPRKHGKSDYNEVLFDVGDELPIREAAPLWKQFNADLFASENGSVDVSGAKEIEQGENDPTIDEIL